MTQRFLQAFWCGCKCHCFAFYCYHKPVNISFFPTFLFFVHELAAAFSPTTIPASGDRCSAHKDCMYNIQSDINNLRWGQLTVQIKTHCRWDKLRWVTFRQTHANYCLPKWRMWADADVRSAGAPLCSLLWHRSLGCLLLIESEVNLGKESLLQHGFHLFGHTGMRWRCVIAGHWSEEIRDPERGWEAQDSITFTVCLCYTKVRLLSRIMFPHSNWCCFTSFTQTLAENK